MRPLPRVHAVTDGDVLALEDLAVRAAAIASGGASVALHVRDRKAGGARIAAMTRRFMTLASPPQAAVVVNGHPDIAAALGAHGVQLKDSDLRPADARTFFHHGWIGCSVHTMEEAGTAVDQGADYLMVGTIFPTSSHPGGTVGGPELIAVCAGLGVPVIAIGGITPDRIAEVRRAGAYGVASISALWSARDPAAATAEFLRSWGTE
ncbi:MAG: thiamine phosphate synthase [Gemmatimonadota bacterium]